MKMALRFLWREWRGGEITLLASALVLAVAIVTAISLFAERLQGALVAESRSFLAADLILESAYPVHADWVTHAEAQGLRTAHYIQFPSMVFAGEAMYLASVKAVSAQYPLAGKVEVAQEAFVQGTPATGIPARGEVWVNARILALLDITIGGELWIGDQVFRVSHILAREPDSGSSMYFINATVMMNVDDIAATHVVKPGSRVQYRYLFAGAAPVLDAYKQWLQPQMSSLHKLIGLDDHQPGIAQSLNRAKTFLLLSGSLGVMLSGLAIGMASRRYAERHIDVIAVMKTLGAGPAAVTRLFFLQVLFLVLVAVVCGWFAGWVFHHGFLLVLQHYIPANLPAAGLHAYSSGGITGVVCALAFVFPPLLAVRQVAPVRVLRREDSGVSLHILWQTLPGIAGIFLLMLFYSGNVQLASVVMGGALVAVAVFASISMVLLRTIRLAGMQAGSIWRLAFSSLKRHAAQGIMQVTVFGLIILLLLTVILVRSSLLDEWRTQLPADAPNHFLINIAPDEVGLMKQWMEQQQLPAAGWYPMVRGRLTKINGVQATSIIPESVNAVYRELNLTWSATLPDDNTLVEGQWWDKQAMPDGVSVDNGVSVEKELGKRLGLKLGDRLTFTIGDQETEAVLTSVRELDWSRMTPNFYFMFPPGVLEQFPSTWITSFYLPADKKLLLNDLVREFPTVTILEVDVLIAQVHRIVDQVSLAVELVLSLVLLAGAVVLLASLQASRDARLQENAILRAIGAGRKLLLGSVCIEYIILGFVAGLLAACGSELVVWLLQTRLFKMEWQPHLWLLLAGPAAGMLLIAGIGVLLSLSVVRVAPVAVLREI